MAHCTLDALEEKGKHVDGFIQLASLGPLSAIVPTTDPAVAPSMAMCMFAVLQKRPGEPAEAYLGLLYPTEEHKVYG